MKTSLAQFSYQTNTLLNYRVSRQLISMQSIRKGPASHFSRPLIQSTLGIGGKVEGLLASFRATKFPQQIIANPLAEKIRQIIPFLQIQSIATTKGRHFLYRISVEVIQSSERLL